MADDNKILLELDLDTGKFTQKIKGVDDQFDKLGKNGTKSVEGIGSSVTKLASKVVSLAALYKTLQFAVEAVFNADEIEKVSRQFDVLTKSAGIAGNKLSDALKAASLGKIDDTDLIMSANKAIVSLGKEAQRLPEVLALAQKTTALYGGDLKENFENLVHAASTGNTRLLKQQGIVLDADKAIKEYAKSIGVTADSLSQAGRAQALMSGILNQGGSKYKDVKVQTDTATAAFSKLKVALQNLKETVEVVTKSSIGETVKNWIGAAAKSVQGITNFLIRTTGSGREQASLELEKYQSDLKNAKQMLSNLEKEEAAFAEQTGGKVSQALQNRRAKLDEQVIKINELINAQQIYVDSLNKEAEAKDAASVAGGQNQDQAVDPAKRAEQQKEFYKSLEALRMQNTQLELQAAQQVGDFDRAQMLEKQRLGEAYSLQVQDIALKEQQGVITKIQANDLVLQADANLRLQLEASEQNLYEKRKAALEAWVNDSKSASEANSRAFAAMSKQASSDITNFAAIGKARVESFKTHSVSAFAQFGAGTKTAAEAAKGFLFNMLADEAEARGKLMLFASILPPNPAGIAGGGALIALAGYLRSQAGGGAGGGAAASGGGSVEAVAPQAQSSNEAVEQNQQQKKAVTVAIQGNYFETDQTRTRLMEMIRESGDFTDFNLKQIGQS